MRIKLYHRVYCLVYKSHKHIIWKVRSWPGIRSAQPTSCHAGYKANLAAAADSDARLDARLAQNQGAFSGLSIDAAVSQMPRLQALVFLDHHAISILDSGYALQTEQPALLHSPTGISVACFRERNLTNPTANANKPCTLYSSKYDGHVLSTESKACIAA